MLCQLMRTAAPGGRVPTVIASLRYLPLALEVPTKRIASFKMIVDTGPHDPDLVGATVAAIAKRGEKRITGSRRSYSECNCGISPRCVASDSDSRTSPKSTSIGGEKTPRTNFRDTVTLPARLHSRRNLCNALESFLQIASYSFRLSPWTLPPSGRNIPTMISAARH